MSKDSKKTTKSRAKVRARGRWLSHRELSRLRTSLREAQETLDAIRDGEVDAVVVQGPRGSRIYSLTGAEQPYRVFVERMQEGAATVSEDGLILYANQRFADMVGHPLERVMGASLPSFLGSTTWQEVAFVLREGADVIKCETLLPRPNAPGIPVHVTASRLPLLEQSLLCLILTDLSAQKQNEELRLAKEVAEKANAAKDGFLAALSHELRTPLNPVLMLASAALDNPELPERIRADFASICNNIELEARLIDDLLDLTRIAHGKLLLNTSVVDVNSVLTSALKTMQSDLDRKRIELVVNLEKRACCARADIVRLQQVFWNILKNAAKFTPEEGQIRVTTQALTSQGKVVVTISDNGIGLTKEELGRVFDTFAQGDHAVGNGAHQFGGLGLGLSISKKIMNMHAGDIHAMSEGRGRGASFFIELPLVLARLRAAKADDPPVVPEGGEVSSVGMRVLLVEDHEPTRTALTRLLARWNHHVLPAADAREARELVQDSVFDVVISDIGLPDANGLDLMKELHERYGLSGIALTGYGMERDVVSSQQSGFVTHLTKPVRISALVEALKLIGAPEPQGAAEV